VQAPSTSSNIPFSSVLVLWLHACTAPSWTSSQFCWYIATTEMFDWHWHRAVDRRERQCVCDKLVTVDNYADNTCERRRPVVKFYYGTKSITSITSLPLTPLPRSRLIDRFYTVSQKRHQTLARNFTKYWPIFKIFFTVRLSRKYVTKSYTNTHSNTVWTLRIRFYGVQINCRLVWRTEE